MNAEIIAVGSEMLTPARVDTNSLFLTGELNNLGIEVVSKCVVGDDRARLTETVRIAAARSQVVILTGGLGPTEDDLTREAVASATGKGLTFHGDIAAALEERFLKMVRKMAEINKRQAFVIDGAEVLPNDRGTAPGQWVEHAGAIIVLLPGPPHEMKAMWERQCLPRFERIAPPLAIRVAQFRVTGMSESDLDQLIAPVYTKYTNPATTILAAGGDLQIHLRARCASIEESDALLQEVAAPIEGLLGDRLYSRNGDPLDVVVGHMLRERRATVSVAESCTGGMLGERLTAAPGSSDYFVGGFLTYTNGMKTALLGVPSDVIAKFGAVSPQTAEAMAAGARTRTGSTYALSVTGVAGPATGGESVPVGTVYVGVADDAGTLAVHRQFIGDRTRIRAFTCQMALDVLRRRMAH